MLPSWLVLLLSFPAGYLAALWSLAISRRFAEGEDPVFAAEASALLSTLIGKCGKVKEARFRNALSLVLLFTAALFLPAGAALLLWPFAGSLVVLSLFFMLVAAGTDYMTGLLPDIPVFLSALCLFPLFVPPDGWPVNAAASLALSACAWLMAKRGEALGMGDVKALFWLSLFGGVPLATLVFLIAFLLRAAFRAWEESPFALWLYAGLASAICAAPFLGSCPAPGYSAWDLPALLPL